MTSHALAKELLSKPNGFLIAAHGGKELTIDNYQRKFTQANMDDGMLYWVLNLHETEKDWR